MGRKKGEKDEAVIEREKRAWELRCQGWSQIRIGVELGVDNSTICKILARLRARVLAQTASKAEAYKAEQHALCEHLIDEALQEWQRSKRNAVKATRQTDAGSGDGDVASKERTSRTDEVREGDVAYLDRALAAMERQAKLWGLDAPVKREITGKDGGAIRQHHSFDFDALAGREAEPNDEIENEIEMARGFVQGLALPGESNGDGDDDEN